MRREKIRAKTYRGEDRFISIALFYSFISSRTLPQSLSLNDKSSSERRRPTAVPRDDDSDGGTKFTSEMTAERTRCDRDVIGESEFARENKPVSREIRNVRINAITMCRGC